MTKQVINTGTSANDGTGDTLRGAAIKINSNTDELFGHANSTSNPHSTTAAQVGALASGTSTQSAYFGNVLVSNATSTHYLNILNFDSTATADHLLGLILNNGDRSISLSANLAVTGASTINQDVSTTASPSWSKLTSTVATGTAPFTIASTTLVTNLNADLLGGQHGSFYQNAANLNTGVLAIAQIPTGTSGTTVAIGNDTRIVNAIQSSAIGSTVQAFNAGLTSLAAAAWSAGTQVPVLTAANTYSLKTVGASTGNLLDKGSGDTLYLAIGGTAANAALLNGQNGAFYQSATNLTTGTLNDLRLPGTMTAKSFSGPITSTVATGTAPLVIASTTLVTNLNADLLDGLDSTYFLNATNLSTGTVADGRLSSNIPLKNGSNIYSAVQTTSIGISASVSEYLHFTPTDYAVGKPMMIVKSNGLAAWQIGLWDGSSNTGTIDFYATTVTIRGNPVWHSGNMGSGSGLDSDLLDGQHGSFYQNASNINTGTISNSFLPGTMTGKTFSGQIVSTLATGTAPLSVTSTTICTNLNAGLLNGQTGSFYQSATNITAGTLDDARLPSTMTAKSFSGPITSTVSSGTAPFVVASPTLVTNLNADLLDGLDSTYFTNATNISTGVLASAQVPPTITQAMSFSANVTVGGTALFAAGAVTTPSISFSAETNLGFYRNTTAQVTYTASGVARLILYGGGICAATGTGALLATSASSSTVPTLLPNRSGTTTGMGAAAAGQISLIANASEVINVSSTAVAINQPLTHQGLAPSSGTSIDQILSTTTSLTLSTSWQDTSVKSTTLATGSYLLQMTLTDTGVGGTQNTEMYTGYMSWYAGDTNDTVFDEIPLHRAGVSPGARAIYLRTIETVTADANDLKLQIASDGTDTGSTTITIKFRRLI